MTEPIEKWREEFEKWFIGDLDVSLKRDKEGNYTFMSAYSAWNAWLAAKRSQPVVEVEISQKFVSAPGYYCRVDAIESELNRHGIKYRIKGD